MKVTFWLFRIVFMIVFAQKKSKKLLFYEVCLNFVLLTSIHRFISIFNVSCFKINEKTESLSKVSEPLLETSQTLLLEKKVKVCFSKSALNIWALHRNIFKLSFFKLKNSARDTFLGMQSIFVKFFQFFQESCIRTKNLSVWHLPKLPFLGC